MVELQKFLEGQKMSEDDLKEAMPMSAKLTKSAAQETGLEALDFECRIHWVSQF